VYLCDLNVNIFKNKYLIFCTFRVKTIKLRRLMIMIVADVHIFTVVPPPSSISFVSVVVVAVDVAAVVVLVFGQPHRVIYAVAVRL